MTQTLEAPARETEIILGRGEYRYRCLHDWLVPPDWIIWGDTHGLAQDARGNIYVGHTAHPASPCRDAIAVFNAEGRFIRSFGERFAGGSHGLELRQEGDHEYLYHCDTARRQVVKTDLYGRVIWEMGLPQESGVYGEGDAFIPTNVAFAPNGDFYVTDGYGSDWIHQFDIQGNYLRTFGGKGRDAGKVRNAHGIGVDPRGSEPLLVIADRANSRLQYFTLDGHPISFVYEGLRQPCHVAFSDGLALIPDLKSVVTLLDDDNRVITHLGDGDPSDLRGRPRSDFRPGEFIHPHDAIFLNNGGILVAEWVPIGRLTLLQRIR